MEKSNRLIIIHYIEERLRAGEQRAAILAKVQETWQQIPQRTFDRYLQKANQNVLEQLEREKRILNDQSTQLALQEQEKAIISAQERKVFLSNIVRGDIVIPTKEPRWDPDKKAYVIVSIDQVPGHSTRISAIQELNRMDGEHAPNKVARTTAKGKDVKPVQAVAPYSDQQVEKILKAIKRKKFAK